jgi:glucuronate isomerase
MCHLPKIANKEGEVDQVLKANWVKRMDQFCSWQRFRGRGYPKASEKTFDYYNPAGCRSNDSFLDKPTTGLGNKAAALVIKVV